MIAIRHANALTKPDTQRYAHGSLITKGIRRVLRQCRKEVREMTERITSTPEQIACVQLPEREFGLASDEMNQTHGGILLIAPLVVGALIICYPDIVDDYIDYISETWDSLDDD